MANWRQEQMGGCLVLNRRDGERPYESQCLVGHLTGRAGMRHNDVRACGSRPAPKVILKQKKSMVIYLQTELAFKARHVEPNNM